MCEKTGISSRHVVMVLPPDFILKVSSSNPCMSGQGFLHSFRVWEANEEIKFTR